MRKPDLKQIVKNQMGPGYEIHDMGWISISSFIIPFCKKHQIELIRQYKEAVAFKYKFDRINQSKKNPNNNNAIIKPTNNN